MPWPQRLTIGLWAATAVFLGLGVWAAAALGTAADVAIFVVSLVTSAAPLGAGLLAIRHAPGNWVATCLTAAGTALVLINAHGAWQDALAADPDSLPASPLLFVLTQGVWMAWFVPYALAVALFPDGVPHGRLGRWSVGALLVIPVAFNLLTALMPGPLMPPLQDWPRPLGTHPVGYVSLGLLPLFLGALVGSVWSLARRHRAATEPARRAQLRWMLLAAAVVPLTLVLCWVGYSVVGHPGPVIVGLVTMNVAVPVATLVAMLRYDLYDVDRAIVLTGAYSALALGILGGYAVVSGLVGRALGEESVTAAVVATVVVMLALLPARAFLLRALGRRLHPRRAAGLAAVRALADRVNAGTGAPEELEGVLRTALRDDGLRVGYRRPGVTTYHDSEGRPLDRAGGAQPITSLGHDVGVIVHGPTAEPVPADVVAAASLLADSVRMREELTEALTEAEASRQRLIRAGDEERRRLERDLHDGAQQRLVALGMRLRVAQRQARAGAPMDTDLLIDDAVEGIGEAVRDLRSVAHGLRPSSLDDGLHAALDNMTRSVPLPITVRCAVQDLPDHVSLTAYFVASEAVANVIKHAGATRVDIEVCESAPRAARILVRDDGCGGARVLPGSGLAGLRDRVSSLGGSLRVDSAPSGTTVEAVIPCGS